MVVLTALSGPLLTKLEAALGHQHILKRLEPAHAQDATSFRGADIVILDPSTFGARGDPVLRAAVAGVGADRVIAYTPSTPAALRHTMELVRAGMCPRFS